MDKTSEAEQLKELGNKEFGNGNHDSAIEYYSKAIDLEPSPIYYANRAACYAAKLQMEKSHDDCVKALEKDPTYIKAFLRKGYALLSLGKVLEAEIDFNKILGLQPKSDQAKTQLKSVENIRTLTERGAKALQEGNWSEALVTYEQILKTCTCSVDFKLCKADALIGMKQYDQAKKIATEILQRDSENTHALLVRGVALYSMGELSSATKIFANILQLDPDNGKANKLRKQARQIENLKEEGNKEFKARNYEVALKLWTEALVDPSLNAVNKLLYANKGAALKSLGRYEEAIEALTKSIELDEDYIKAYIRRAQCYMEVKKYEEAERDYMLSNSKEPQNKEIKKGLAEAKRLRKIASRKDYYQILRISKDTFNEAGLAKVYKKRCLETHPDRQPPEKREEAEKEFKTIQEAYDILKDPRKRQAYDSGADLEEINNGGGGGGGFGGEGVDLAEVFNVFRQNGGGGGVRYSSSGFGGHSHGQGGGFPF